MNKRAADDFTDGSYRWGTGLAQITALKTTENVAFFHLSYRANSPATPQ